jgi:hypothetical protein
VASKLTEVIVDAADPEEIAAFWMAALGYQKTGNHEGWVQIGDPGAPGVTLTFVPVAEPKTTKNRLHIDLSPFGCDQAEEVARLVGLGARRIDIGQGEQSWVVLADPDGNEFCVLATRVG